MIQRIQSLYLGLALVLTFLLFALPFAVFSSAGQGLYLYMFEIVGSEIEQSILMVLPILTCAAIALLSATIGLFRNRKLQMRLCHLSLVVQLGITVAAIFILYIVFQWLFLNLPWLVVTMEWTFLQRCTKTTFLGCNFTQNVPARPVRIY